MLAAGSTSGWNDGGDGTRRGAGRPCRASCRSRASISFTVNPSLTPVATSATACSVRLSGTASPGVEAATVSRIVSRVSSTSRARLTAQTAGPRWWPGSGLVQSSSMPRPRQISDQIALCSVTRSGSLFFSGLSCLRSRVRANVRSSTCRPG